MYLTRRITHLFFPQAFLFYISSYIYLSSVHITFVLSVYYPCIITKRGSVSHCGPGVCSVWQSPSVSQRGRSLITGAGAETWAPELCIVAGTITIRWFIVVIIAVYIYDGVSKQKESFFTLPQLFRDFFIRTPCLKERRGLGKDRKDSIEQNISLLE